MLPTKNILSNLLKLLTKTLSLFYHGYNKNGIFDDVIITSALRSDMAL